MAVNAPKEKLPLHQTTLLTVWNDIEKRNVYLTLEKSVEDTRDNWNAVDYGVMLEMYNDDIAGVKSLMKKLGYYENSRSNGAVFFQHYTRKVK